MNDYLESVRAYSDALTTRHVKEKTTKDATDALAWEQRLTPLEDRLAKLLSNIPSEIKSQGLSLPAIRTMLAGKWRGRCHPGELGDALRRLGYSRRRDWSARTHGFPALWFLPDLEADKKKLFDQKIAKANNHENSIAEKFFLPNQD
jgi:hypothetical protein